MRAAVGQLLPARENIRGSTSATNVSPLYRAEACLPIAKIWMHHAVYSKITLKEHQPPHPHLQRTDCLMLRKRWRRNVTKLIIQSPRIEFFFAYWTPSKNKASGTQGLPSQDFTTGCSEYAGGMAAIVEASFDSQSLQSAISSARVVCGGKEAKGRTTLPPSPLWKVGTSRCVKRSSSSSIPAARSKCWE